MDRRNSCNNINRNTSNFFNHLRSKVVRNNLVTPEIFVSEIWMQEGAKNGVEIIELNSSNSELEEITQEPANNFSQVWSFLNQDRFRKADEYYGINNIARERWRNNNEELSVAYANEYMYDHDTQTNFNGIHYIDNSEISGIPHNQQMNCFTIINNHVINSDSSSDNDFAKVEEIETHSENNNDNRYWDHVYNEDNNVIAYDPANTEKRTVWIYSFKNKRRLTENDFELVNIPSKDSTSTSNSLSDEEHNAEKGSNSFRIASPIPPTFIPRLDLSLAQTLSTVTEISEIKNSEGSTPESLTVKPINNWLTERHIAKSMKANTRDSVVNWMALSPRERRRRFNNTNSNIDHAKTKNMREFTYAEGSTQNEQTKEKSIKQSSVIQADVEVHANDIPVLTPEKPNDVKIVSIESFEMKPRVEKKKATNTLSIHISYADADTEIDHERGDFEFDPNTKPSIQLTSNKTYDVITDPIEKLNSNNWIVGEATTEEQTAAFDYVLEDTETQNESFESDFIDSVSKRLWMKNAKLMKSPLWAEYLPITETPPSLHLSLSLSSTESKTSWFKRIKKYFKCCK